MGRRGLASISLRSLTRPSLVAAALLVAALAPVACGADRRAGGRVGSATVSAFVASSLTDAFEALAATSLAQGGPDIRVHPGGSAQLVTQLRSGLPADLLATADRASMDRAVEAGVVAASPVELATNRLVIAVERGNPKAITGLADLARPGLLVALAAPEVPAGAYARQALARAGVNVRPTTEEQSVRAALTKVVIGEVDAAIVYATDVGLRSTVDAVAIPPEDNVVVRYYLAPVAADPGPAVSRVLALLTGPDGRRTLTRLGFGVP